MTVSINTSCFYHLLLLLSSFIKLRHLQQDYTCKKRLKMELQKWDILDVTLFLLFSKFFRSLQQLPLRQVTKKISNSNTGGSRWLTGTLWNHVYLAILYDSCLSGSIHPIHICTFSAKQFNCI